MGLVITFSNFILIAYTYVGFSLVILLRQDLRRITGFRLKNPVLSSTAQKMVFGCGVSIDFQPNFLEFVPAAVDSGQLHTTGIKPFMLNGYRLYSSGYLYPHQYGGCDILHQTWVKVFNYTEI